jgi:hypothetical protein
MNRRIGTLLRLPKADLIKPKQEINSKRFRLAMNLDFSRRMRFDIL